MTFLNPLVLIGLVGAAIPVILHLLNLRKLRTIEFSTLAFLKELQQTKIRRLKLRQLLLLITRTLLVIFIVLAFARPALRGTFLGNLGTYAHSSIVYILDDSFSMMGNDEHGERFKQAKETVGKLIDLLKDGDEVYLIKLSDIPQATIDPATHDFAGLRRIVTESHVSSIRRSLDDAIRLASKLLQRSTNANKEVYLISDLQRTLFPEISKHGQQQTVSLFNEQTNFFVIPIGTKDIGNAAIDSLAIKTTILEKDKPVTISALISNHNSVSLRNYVVSAYLDGIKASQQNVSVSAGGSIITDLTVTPQHAGFLKGYIELENDAIEMDNRRYFTLFIPPQINIAFVSSSPGDEKFILLALHAGQDESEKSLFNIQRIPAQKFPLFDLKSIDVLVCSDIKSFSVNDVSQIKKFLERGGGFIYFPGDDVDIDNFNTTLLRSLHIPSIENIKGGIGQGAQLSFGKFDLDHPLFATIFEKEQTAKKQSARTIESPNISKTLQWHAGKEARTIISLNDGGSFLSEYTFGTGKILFYSVTPTLNWSDFPLKGIFAPLIYRSMLYVSLPSMSYESYITGDEPIIDPRNILQENGNKKYSIVTPDGVEELIQPSAQSTLHGISNSTPMFTLKRLTMSGFYELKNGTSPFFVFSVNTDYRESDTKIIDNDDLQGSFNHWGIASGNIHIIKQGEPMQTSILQTRYGTELWRYCILLALLMTIVEMLLARDSRKTAEQK